jgi:hypothetical protein
MQRILPALAALGIGAAVLLGAAPAQAAPTLVTRTATVEVAAGAVIRSHSGYNASASCTITTAVTCSGTVRDADAETYAVRLSGLSPIPAKVRAAYRYGVPSVRVTQVVKSVKGDAYWTYAPYVAATWTSAETGYAVAKGVRSGAFQPMPAKAQNLMIEETLRTSGTVSIKRFTITYRYLAKP